MVSPFVIYILVAIVVLIFIRQIYVAIINDSKVRSRNKPVGLFAPLENLSDETRDDKMEIRKRMIVNRAHELKKIDNDMVQALFHISHSTAWRYLEELENEGRLLQVGKIGRSVYYEPSVGAF